MVIFGFTFLEATSFLISNFLINNSLKLAVGGYNLPVIIALLIEVFSILLFAFISLLATIALYLDFTQRKKGGRTLDVLLSSFREAFKHKDC